MVFIIQNKILEGERGGREEREINGKANERQIQV